MHKNPATPPSNQPLGIHRYARRVNLSQDVSGAHLDSGVRYTFFFFGRNMQVLVKKTSVLSAETCTFPPTILFFQLVGATRKTKERRLLSASLLKKLCLWDGIQTTSDITCGEPAVNISGKLSLLQQVFTHYIYIYII